MPRPVLPSLMAMACLVAGLSGCTFQTPNSIRRVWCDHNTLHAPALFLEKHDHLPYHHARVDYFRWMYNMGPIVPVASLPAPDEGPPVRKPGCFDRPRCANPSPCPPPCHGEPTVVRQRAESPRAEVLPDPAEFEPPPLPSEPPGVSTDGPTAAGTPAIQLATGTSPQQERCTKPVRPRGGWLFGR